MTTVVGDDIVFLGRAHRVVRIEPYQHPDYPDEQWAMAYDAYGWAITLIPASRSSVDGSVVSGGTLGQGTRRTSELPNWQEAGGSVSDPSSAVPPADDGIRTTEAISA